MKFINTLRSNFKRLTKKTVAGMMAVVVATSVLAGIPLAHAEYYPARTPFDYSKPCNPNDADIYDRCGSLTGPVFNSFINTPSYGDERAFLDARRSDQTAAGSYKNVLANVNEGSKEVVIRMYVHNNANQSTNESGLGIARNTKVRVDLPESTGQVARARGYISADNAAMVEDTVDFTGTEDFSMAYVPGSAILYDNDNFSGGTALNDSIVTTGAPIGTDSLNGNLKGCFEFEVIVQLKVKINVKQPTVEFKKQVNLASQNGWVEKVSSTPGTRIKWLITFTNKGQVDLTKVNISDQLPAHLSIVPGSVKWIYTGTDGKTQEAVQSDTQLFTTGGSDFATWKPNGGFYLRFETILKDDFQGCSVTIRNIAFNKTDQTPKVEDTADVVITKENCQPAPPPVTPVTTTPTPTTLPVTGPGDIIGIFAAVSVAGGLAHKFVLARGRKF